MNDGLLVTGEKGHRVALSETGSQMTEACGCGQPGCTALGWVMLNPVRTWAEWREMARLILDTPVPGSVDPPETAGT
jgi:hypothetical protein